MSTQRITYLEALLLEKISEGRAEIYRDREPVSVFISNRVGDEDLVPIIDKFMDLHLLDERASGSRSFYVINPEGRAELRKFF